MRKKNTHVLFTILTKHWFLAINIPDSPSGHTPTHSHARTHTHAHTRAHTHTLLFSFKQVYRLLHMQKLLQGHGGMKIIARVCNYALHRAP